MHQTFYIITDIGIFQFLLTLYLYQRVVIVLVGELPDLDTMSEDLKMYVRARSYISTADSWFWRKLRYNNQTKEIWSYFIVYLCQVFPVKENQISRQGKVGGFRRSVH